MSANQERLMLGVAVVAGLVGSVLSGFLFPGSAVWARRTPTPVEVLSAERFELVDKEGQPRARLSLGESGEPAFDLYDQDFHRLCRNFARDGCSAMLLP